jgi:trans-aconitate 2-methyltransferase
MPWNPDQYHRFQRERFLPFEDLLALIDVRPGLRVIDLGCGTGELTRRLADHLPESEVLGIDSSPQMLERAAAQARPGLRFELRALEATDGEWDLVFSHAVIQWVDDHSALVPRLLSLARPGGQLAVQMPSSHNHPTQQFIREIAGDEPFRTALNGWVRISPVLPVDAYAELLHEHGATEMTVFEKVYPHLLENADALAEWTSGTVMVPYFERLPDPLREAFLQRYRERLRERWPESPVFHPFRRILFAGKKR